MAVVSAIALLVALGLVALLSLQPWAPSSIAPRLSVSPGPGVGLGDSVVVSRSRQFAVAPAQPVKAVTPRLIDAGVAVEEGESQPQLGIAAARVVTSAGPVQSPGASPVEPAPEVPPPALPAVVPAPVPVSASPPEPPPLPPPAVAGSGGEISGPIVAGGGVAGGGTANVIQVCEGDDYTLPLSPAEGAEGSKAPPPVVPHDLTVYFGSSSEGAGFHLVLFDGQPVELGDDPVPIEPGKSCAQIDLGPLLDESIEAGTEIHVEAVTLGEVLEPVVP